MGAARNGLPANAKPKSCMPPGSALAKRAHNDEDPYRFHEPFRTKWGWMRSKARRFRADARGPGRSPASAPGAPLSGNPLIAPVGQRFGETHGSFAAPTAAIYAVEPVQHFGVALDDEISLINRSTT